MRILLSILLALVVLAATGKLNLVIDAVSTVAHTQVFNQAKEAIR